MEIPVQRAIPLCMLPSVAAAEPARQLVDDHDHLWSCRTTRFLQRFPRRIRNPAAGCWPGLLQPLVICPAAANPSLCASSIRSTSRRAVASPCRPGTSGYEGTFGQRTGRAARRNYEACQQLTPEPEQIPHCAAPDACTFADDAHGLPRLRLRRLQIQWSRPAPSDVCSMFARMPRYPPAASGIRCAPPVLATRQNGSSRHVLALLDSTSRRRTERRSRLLICGFGVQVPGGAPNLTCGFTAPSHFYVSVLCPCLLHVCSRARTQQSGPCHNRPVWRRIWG